MDIAMCPSPLALALTRSPAVSLLPALSPAQDPVHGVFHNMYQKWIAAPSPPFRPRVYGHFVSRDLVRWARMPVAIWNGLDVPNGTRTEYDDEAIFSGAAAVIPGFAPDGKGLGVVNIYPGECAATVQQLRHDFCVDIWTISERYLRSVPPPPHALRGVLYFVAVFVGC